VFPFNIVDTFVIAREEGDGRQQWELEGLVATALGNFRKRQQEWRLLFI
jgi:hypothetical protein